MIALYNFVPKFCPQCGHELKIIDRLSVSDYYNHASHGCPKCDTGFQYVKTEDVLEAASKNGDLSRYYED